MHSPSEKRASIPSLCLLGAFALASSLEASVTIKGKVEHWDQITKTYQPTKRAMVEIEGDWWWASDPQVSTSDEGLYSCSIENPPWWWDNYDGVDIEVYARTEDVVEVYESIVALWPYHAVSKETDNVTNNEVVEINLKIGGPSNNAADSYYRTIEETANAFIVHQSVLAQYVKLKGMNFPSDFFDEVEVIVPAANVGASYYNNITGYINLAIPGAGYLGEGNWKKLPTESNPYAALNEFVYSVQHEYTHAIHDESTGWIAPLGLDQPAFHSPEMESNRFLAYTEGLAEFLPLAVNGLKNNRFEWSRANGIQKPVATPAHGNHWAMEGEVCGLLLDIWDNNPQEICRLGVSNSVEGLDVPEIIIRNQMFKDRISDPDLVKIRHSWSHSVEDWPVQTIGEFLDSYKRAYPADLHGIKAIAYNRSTARSMPPEEPARIVSEPRISRLDRRITLTFDVLEPDAEDRPFVWAEIWHQQADGKKLARIDVIGEQSDWTSNPTRTVRHVFNHPPACSLDGYFWLVLTDDILPLVYRIGMPENGKDKLFKASVQLADDARIKQVQAANAAFDAAQIYDPSTKKAIAFQQLTKTQAQQNAALRATLKDVREELQLQGRNEKLLLRQQRGMYKLASEMGGFKGTADAKLLFRKNRSKGALPALTPTMVQQKEQFAGWMADFIKSPRLTRSLKPSDLSPLKAHLATVEAAVRKQSESATRITALRQKLSQNLARFETGAQASVIREQANASVTKLDQALGTLQQNAQLHTQLLELSRSIKALTQTVQDPKR